MRSGRGRRRTRADPPQSRSSARRRQLLAQQRGRHPLSDAGSACTEVAAARGAYLICLELAFDPDAEFEPRVELEAEVGKILRDACRKDERKGDADPAGGGEGEHDEHVRQVLKPEACACVAGALGGAVRLRKCLRQIRRPLARSELCAAEEIVNSPRDTLSIQSKQPHSHMHLADHCFAVAAQCPQDPRERSAVRVEPCRACCAAWLHWRVPR